MSEAELLQRISLLERKVQLMSAGMEGLSPLLIRRLKSDSSLLAVFPYKIVALTNLMTLNLSTNEMLPMSAESIKSLSDPVSAQSAEAQVLQAEIASQGHALQIIDSPQHDALLTKPSKA